MSSLQRLLLTAVLLLPASPALAFAPHPPQDRTPEQAVAGLDVGGGLEVTLFAAEPLLLSPSNIDVDHLGRVWVCEVVNYRGFRNKHEMREEGDRILILEDTDGDGRADKQTVFYQGRDIDSAHGVCVLGDSVIVSAGDSVFVFRDTDNDGKADSREVLFTGIGGVQHDHGIHSFVFGPDGKLYFNFGNEGHQIKDKNGKPIIDQAGNEVNDKRRPYQQGMVFRCNLDGSEFETLGWNFRNNWEVAVDSFGTLWQSDNDDDGNRGVRINFVMEFGNYGYRDELTGAGWRESRTGMHATIPERHWHLNDPGVVPNLLQTGAGSPTGICVYEGDLLPANFRGQVIHCDAGPNVVRAYPVTTKGAGYHADILNILQGARDNWFRPSDVCVAPDGSLLIADWYDPGVGGHAMGDINRGRIFRVAPPGTPYKSPAVNLETAEGAVSALCSPNLATRYLGWQTLAGLKDRSGEAALRKLYATATDDRLKARALWLLGEIGQTETYVNLALRDRNEDIRITGLRLARRKNLDLEPLLLKLAKDPISKVRRECAIALRTIDSDAAPGIWAELAVQYTGDDRWYLEALGIAADGRWDACLAVWMDRINGDWKTPPGRDIVWRSRGETTPRLLADILHEKTVSASDAPRYLRAFDFQSAPHTQQVLLQLAFADIPGDADRRRFVSGEALSRVYRATLAASSDYRDRLDGVLKELAGTRQFTRLVRRFGMKERHPDLLAMAQANATNETGIEAVRALLAAKEWSLVTDAMLGKDQEAALATADVLGNSADGNAAGPLMFVVKNADAPVSVRRAAVRNAGKLNNAARQLVALVEKNELDDSLRQAVAVALHSSRSRQIKEKADQLFPLPAAKDNKPLPSLAELLKMKGDSRRGRLVFHNSGTCFKCHKEGGIGREVGPDLSEIGSKLSRQAMFDSILYPSAGISHNYETWVVALDTGITVNGLLISETPDSVTIRDDEAIDRTFQRAEVDEMVKQDVSLMPADLQKVMTAQELVDVVEFMTTLRKTQK